MTYDEIFSSFYPLITDKDFFNLPEDYAYNLMTRWLHAAISDSRIRKIFSTITLDDEIMECNYALKDSIDKDSDKDFVLSVFSQYMVIQWLRPKVDSQINIARMIGGKEEKNLQANYKPSMERLDTLENNLKKFIRDHNTEYNSYLQGGT